MKKTILLNFLIPIFTVVSLYAQTNVAITLDDVPNTRKFERDNYQSILLDKLDSIAIPIAIFINEGLIYKTDSISKNFELLNDWIKTDYITVGNHTFSHSRYSELGFESFKLDIEKGEYITRELTNKYTKSLHYFRFPYNDLGKDSTQHEKIDSLLQAKKYLSTPFTIESSDWMFNYIYEHYLKNNEFEAAAKIGNLYVEKTLAYFEFYDSLSTTIYGRKVNQIYLCHDNSLNADYLIKIIAQLKTQNYNFVSLDQALEDTVYQQEYRYYRKWGISWFYRWIPSQKERVKWMKKEPNIDAIYELYQRLVSQNK